MDYTIKATLDTAAKRLTGTEQIRYTNNSPDTLRFVWFDRVLAQLNAGTLLGTEQRVPYCR